MQFAADADEPPGIGRFRPPRVDGRCGQPNLHERTHVPLRTDRRQFVTKAGNERGAANCDPANRRLAFATHEIIPEQSDAESNQTVVNEVHPRATANAVREVSNLIACGCAESPIGERHGVADGVRKLRSLENPALFDATRRQARLNVAELHAGRDEESRQVFVASVSGDEHPALNASRDHRRGFDAGAEHAQRGLTCG